MCSHVEKMGRRTGCFMAYISVANFLMIISYDKKRQNQKPVKLLAHMN